jgi:hypothetical protein
MTAKLNMHLRFWLTELRPPSLREIEHEPRWIGYWALL